MTAAFLQSELTSLISDSKRKNTAVRAAADKSLSDLKSISVTSETQLAGDLIRKPQFIDPFVLACKSQNTKLATNGAACLQRLVASAAIPRPRLADVLQAFEEAVPLALEVQLKVLQTLPSLLQLYATDLQGETLARTLSVSADLSGNKLPVVSSTAGATFQQLVTAVFARAVGTNYDARLQPVDQDLTQHAGDAFAIFIDLCALLTEDKPEFVRLDNLPPHSVLETLEALLSSYGDYILAHPDSLRACSEYLLPGLSGLIESSANYGVVARALRIAFVLLARHLSRLQDSLGDLLQVVLRISDRVSNHRWKRILGLEFFRGLCSDFDALRFVFKVFDLAENETNIVSELMASLVRTASEDPSLIGLGRQSTVPTSQPAEGNGELASPADRPVGVVTRVKTPYVGISSEWSTIATPCLDQYDRTTAAEIPDTYIYTIVLGCVSAFSDGLSKYIMPLSVPNKRLSRIEEVESEPADEQEPQRQSPSKPNSASQTYQHLINPLTRQDLHRRAEVGYCAKMVESCWPAVLATCSTFLNATLDSYFYHMLIRTVQKLTQVSGVLELTTPRDALLTTLAKVSVPANVSSLMDTFYGTKPALKSDFKPQRETDDSSTKSPATSTPRRSLDLTSQSLNVRNLLCLRALINLGIALGPMLSRAAWTIVMQSLEQVEALISVGPTARLAQTSTTGPTTQDGKSTASLADEIAAVDTARRRMIESSKTYPESAFELLCRSLFQMIEDVIPTREHTVGVPNSTLRPNGPVHTSTRSVSGTWAKMATLEVEVSFVLKTVGRIASVNLHRFRDQQSNPSSWNLIIANLLLLQGNRRLVPHLRLQSANIIGAIVVETCTSSFGADEELESSDQPAAIVEYGINALGKQLEGIRAHLDSGQRPLDVDMRTVQIMLEALQNIIGSHGEDLGHGWEGVFTILHRVITRPSGSTDTTFNEALNPSTFKVMQLIMSDFLTTLESQSIMELLNLLEAFGSQQFDLNMSLTTIALYWNVATLVIDEHESAKQDESKDNLTTINNKSRLDLWQTMIHGLAKLCRDDRADARNAAMRMLTKVIDASGSIASPQMLNTCFTNLLLPLLDFYGTNYESSGKLWQDSISQTIKDLVEIVCENGTKLLDHDSFSQTWLKLIQTVSGLLRLEIMSLIAELFDSLSAMVHALRQCENCEGFTKSRAMLEATWTLWKDNHPTDMEHAGPNQTALASHARLLKGISAWNFDIIADLPNVAQIVADAVEKSTFAAVHDQYTVDVSKLTEDQRQTLQVLDIYEWMLVEEKSIYALLLCKLARELVNRTVQVSRDSTRTEHLAKNVKQPTGIAFVTTCVERLRKLLAETADHEDTSSRVPVIDILKLCTCLNNTKYSTIPANKENLLWQKASSLGTECVRRLGDCKSLPHVTDQDLADASVDFTRSILDSSSLEDMRPENRPLMHNIQTDEEFDMTQLRKTHSAISLICNNNLEISSKIASHYPLMLFQHSLVARPWYNDLSPDLEQSPLENLTVIRRGSIRSPDLPVRCEIYREALSCLFDLVSASKNDTCSDTSVQIPAKSSPIAKLAAPYVLLRVAHTLKTFIADQPLRGLEPPHPSLQRELHIVLRAFLDIRVIDDVFADIANSLARGTQRENSPARTEHEYSQISRRDGKSHLRLLWGLLTKFEKVWWRTPRLKKGYAWQDHEHGRGIEMCLKEWKESISNIWGPKWE